MDDAIDLIALPIETIDAKTDIGSVEAPHKNARFPKCQARNDLLAYFGRGGRGHRENGRMPEPFDHRAKLKIIRPKIMSPFADAVRFVHDEKRDAGRGELHHRFRLS